MTDNIDMNKNIDPNNPSKEAKSLQYVFISRNLANWADELVEDEQLADIGNAKLYALLVSYGLYKYHKKVDIPDYPKDLFSRGNHIPSDKRAVNLTWSSISGENSELEKILKILMPEMPLGQIQNYTQRLVEYCYRELTSNSDFNLVNIFLDEDEN